MKLTLTIEIEADAVELQNLLDVVQNFTGTKRVYVEAPKLAPESLQDIPPAVSISPRRHRHHHHDGPPHGGALMPPAAYRAAIAVLVGGPVIAIIARIFTMAMIAG